MIILSETSPSEARRWLNGRFNMRSGYYAGRPPSPGDLNSEILEMFYKGIKKDVGDVEAANFVRFVNNLTDLSACSFIVAFEWFWVEGMKITEFQQQKGDRVMLTGQTEDALLGEALGAIGASMSCNMDERELLVESQSIKQAFINAHTAEIPQAERKKPPRTYIGF